MAKYCVLYSYFETTESHHHLGFFLSNGITDNDNDDIFYVFIINNHKCSLQIPKQDNIKVITRDNIGHDFGSWAHGLTSICTDTYDYFIFMNDTVMGPFLPRYIPSELKWYPMFCNLLSDKVKLSGLSINYVPQLGNPPHLKHVQSMMFCTDAIGLDILKKTIFNLPEKEYEKAIKKGKMNFILKFEIGMSQQIIKKGFEIAALYISDLKNYKTGDIWFNNHYYGTTMNPFEVMFIKKNRVNSPIIKLYTQAMKK